MEHVRGLNVTVVGGAGDTTEGEKTAVAKSYITREGKIKSKEALEGQIASDFLQRPIMVH